MGRPGLARAGRHGARQNDTVLKKIVEATFST
jgi:hypothetical protein